jgi:hypothetical protein
MNTINNNKMEAGTVYHIAAGGTSQQVYICNDTQGGLTVHVGYAHMSEFPDFDGFGAIRSVNNVYYGEESDLISYIRAHEGLVTIQDFNVQDEDYSLLSTVYSELISKIKSGAYESK